MKKIIVEVKQVYGNETIYPICETAKIFASMVQHKTLTARVITDIIKLGYTIEVKAPNLKLYGGVQ